MTVREILAAAAAEHPAQAATCLRYTGDTIAVRGAGELVDGLRERLAPFVEFAPEALPAAVTVEARAVAAPTAIARTRADGVPLVVDASLYVETRSSGHRLDLEDGWLVEIESTATLCAFSAQERSVTLLQPDPTCLARDALRTVKALITASAERHGHVIIHASGVVSEGSATLFAGDSRNGKTTILLQAISGFRASMLSCDTTMLRVSGGQVVARGWPSNFSVSVGTMHDFACLHPLMTPEQSRLTYTQAWDIYPKHVLDTADVLREAGVEIVPEAPVGAVVMLRFAPDKPTAVEPMADAGELRDALAAACLGSRDPLYPNWHGWWTTSDDTIEANLSAVAQALADAGAELCRMTWAPWPQALLRGISSLERACLAKPAPLPPRSPS